MNCMCVSERVGWVPADVDIVYCMCVSERVGWVPADVGAVYCMCVSERVGWVPADVDVPEAVKSTYKWIEGLSVTEMEIMHGAYRKDNPNGMLYRVSQ